MANAENLYRRLRDAVNMTGDEALATHDRVEKLVKRAPEMTVHCRLSHSMQLRRLLIIKPIHWNDSDRTHCEQILAHIEALKRMGTGHSITLALGCVGVRRKALPAALRALVSATEAAQASTEPPEQSGQGVGEAEQAPPEGRPAAAPAKPEVLGSLKDLNTDELDAETAAQLKQLQELVAVETGKVGA